MRRTGFAAMAKIAMHQREYTVIIRPREEGMTLHTIFYANEVRAVPEYGQTRNIEIKPQEVQLAEQLVQSLAAPFDPDKYEDSYQRRLAEMLEAKRQGRVVQETQTKKMAPVIDLMAALQRSLNQRASGISDEEGEKKPAKRAATAAPRKRRAG
jgi:DNA end-binding protein Ku